jgi:hypothetical protein
MRAVWLTALLCGFGAGLVTFPVLVVHLDWPGWLVTLLGLTSFVAGAIATAWLNPMSGKRPAQP